MSWAHYLFNDLNDKDCGPVTSLAPSSEEEIAKRISAFTSSYTTESNEDTFKPNMIFESFHHQVKVAISDRALLAGFLILWLKRCVILTLPHEVIIDDVVYPTVLLAHGKSIALLPVMMACIQSGLRVLTKNFCQVEAVVDTEDNPIISADGRPQVKTPSPRVELPYTYLMTWYVMHCPSLMTTVSAFEGFVPFVQRLEDSSWANNYMFYIRKTILGLSNYQLARCFPDIPSASYGDKFANLVGPDGFTQLPFGVFWWLINIRPGYLILRQGNACMIEPYMSSHFARQFGYDQLYIGNPNVNLHFCENLYEGARAWYYNVAGGDQSHLQPSSQDAKLLYMP